MGSRRLITIAAAVLIGLSMMGSYTACPGETPTTGAQGKDLTPAPEHDPKQPNHTTSPKQGSYGFRITGAVTPQGPVYWTYHCGARNDDQVEIRVDRWHIDCQVQPGQTVYLKVTSPRPRFNYCAISFLYKGREYIRDQNSIMKAGSCVVAWEVQPHEERNLSRIVPLPEPS